MKYNIAQHWYLFNLYMWNRGILIQPLAPVFIHIPIVQVRFALFMALMEKTPRIMQSYFMYKEEVYARTPSQIPITESHEEWLEPYYIARTRAGIINKRTGIIREDTEGVNIIISASRRMGKTVMARIKATDMIQIPLGKQLYAQQMFYNSEDDAKKFYRDHVHYFKLEGIPVDTSETKLSISLGNNSIDYKYTGARGEDRGGRPVAIVADEVGSYLNKVLNKFTAAVKAAMRDFKANILFISSPAESVENTFVTDSMMDLNTSVSFVIPVFFNDGRHEDGSLVNEPLGIAGEAKELIAKNRKYLIKTTIFGMPLLDTGRELYQPYHFYRYTQQSLAPDGLKYSHIVGLGGMSEEDVQQEVLVSDVYEKYAKNTDTFKPILYSFIVGDLSYSGGGDYTVLLHVGVSISGDLYIYDIARKQTKADELDDFIADFVIKCAASPFGETLRIVYIESKSAGMTQRLRTLESISNSFVETKLKPFLNLNNHITNYGDYKIPTNSLYKRVSRILFGGIDPIGGIFVENSSKDILHSANPDDILILQTIGKKINRADSALTVLARKTRDFTLDYIGYKKMKIIIYAPNTRDFVIDDFLKELYSVDRIQLDTASKNRSRDYHDDCVDAMNYAVLVVDKVTNFIQRGNSFDHLKNIGLSKVQDVLSKGGNTTSILNNNINEVRKYLAGKPR